MTGCFPFSGPFRVLRYTAANTERAPEQALAMMHVFLVIFNLRYCI